MHHNIATSSHARRRSHPTPLATPFFKKFFRADLRVAAEDATFGVFCRRYGVPLIDGGTVRLPRLIGQSRALDMILTGRAVGAAEAKEYARARLVCVCVCDCAFCDASFAPAPWCMRR